MPIKGLAERKCFKLPKGLAFAGGKSTGDINTP